MTVDTHSEEGQIIRQLIPLSTLPANLFESICNKITVEDAESGTFLFKRNDSANDLIYLIEGSITLQSDNLKVESIKSGTNSSRFALAHQIPRKIDAFTNTSVRFLRLNTDIINALPSISYEEDNSYMVIDEPEDENDDDWMTTLLKSPIFRGLPPANLQQIIMSLEQVSFEKGELIIKQNEPGDFYYLIKKGHCLISRKPSPNAKEIKLAQLRNQDTFGEDSLLSDEPRNVNITALTDTTLLRLSKDKFISLIKEPCLKYITHDQVSTELDKGAILLDVRPSDEYKNYHLPAGINAPFFSLRMQLKMFDKKKPVIVVCANGKTSEAAAFLLLRNKVNALIVQGGMEQAPQQTVEPNVAAFAIDDGIETLTENEASLEAKEEQETIANSQPDTKTSADKDNNQNDLLIENQLLKQTVQKLTEEKESLEKKYRLLYKQTEKFKSVLDRLKNGES